MEFWMVSVVHPGMSSWVLLFPPPGGPGATQPFAHCISQSCPPVPLSSTNVTWLLLSSRETRQCGKWYERQGSSELRMFAWCSQKNGKGMWNKGRPTKCEKHRLRVCSSKGVGHHCLHLAETWVRCRSGKASKGRRGRLRYALMEAVGWGSWRKAK